MSLQKQQKLVLEVCVDSVKSAIRLVLLDLARQTGPSWNLNFDNVRRFHSAAQGGADRLEVCGNLGIGGGTTPSLGLIRAIQKALPHLPIMVSLPVSITVKSYVI